MTVVKIVGAIALVLLIVAPALPVGGLAQSDECPAGLALESSGGFRTGISAPILGYMELWEGERNLGERYIGQAGDTFAIWGADLIPVQGPTAVYFGGTRACFDQYDGFSVWVVVPRGFPGSTVEVRVSNTGGTSNALPFTYARLVLPTRTPTGDPPIISYIELASGVAGDTITIVGLNFTEDSRVRFQASGSGGGPSPSVRFVSEIEIEAEVPRLGPRELALDVRVTTPHGTSPTTDNDDFTYEGFVPSTGPGPLRRATPTPSRFEISEPEPTPTRSPLPPRPRPDFEISEPEPTPTRSLPLPPRPLGPVRERD